MKFMMPTKVWIHGGCVLALLAGCATPPPPRPASVVQPRPPVEQRASPAPVSRPAPRSAPPPAPVDEGCGECRRLGEKCSTCGWIEVWTGF